MKTFRINIKNIVTAISVFGLLFSVSCVKDLERTPITDFTSADVYKDFSNYPKVLAKLYGGYATGGQEPGDGNGDVAGIDGGFSQFTRQLFVLQVLPTDEAVNGWNDGNLHTMHEMKWDSSNEFIGALYYRIFTEIASCNEFLRNTTDVKLSENGISGTNSADVKVMRAEARFLRAQTYYYALDMFGNVPFVTEDNLPGSTTPPQRIVRADLFKYIESELLACVIDMKDPKTNSYGRADKAAAWALLARLYLNANVYTGTTKNTECITYCNKIISAGYSLKTKYTDLFLADNDKNNNETIFAVAFDGTNTRSYGGSTYMVHAPVGGKMAASDFGINGGWGGNRTTKAYVNLFGGAGTSDVRGNFYTNGQNLEINDITNFIDGYAFIKYKNVTSSGAQGSDISGNFCDADIPLYRLGDVYLMYAEAVLRGGTGGSLATALTYVNNLRNRAGALPVTAIDLNFILDERGRELGWEMTRRTDLIRFGKFTTAAYLWPWKGNIKNGQAVEDFRNLYPIPAKDIIANPNLVQNTGY